MISTAVLHRSLIVLLGVGCVGFAACSEPLAPEPARPTRIVIKPDTVRAASLGPAGSLGVSIADQYGAATAQIFSITWSILDPSVVRLSESVKPSDQTVDLATTQSGITRVVASAAGLLPDTVVVMVQQVTTSLSVLSVADGETRLPGDTLTLTVTALDAIGSVVPNVPRQWSSSDPSVISIDAATGLAHFNAMGTATITVQAAGFTRTASLRTARLATAKLISLGNDRGCGVTPTGTGFCFGQTLVRGNRNLADSSLRLFAFDFLSPTSIARVAVGEIDTREVWWSHNCFLLDSGQLQCWGNGQTGELDIPPASLPYVCVPSLSVVLACTSTPLPARTPMTWKSITAGGSHTCGLTMAGAAYCWGSNEYGQLGSVTNTTCQVRQPTSCAISPQAVQGGVTFIALAAGGTFTCGLSSVGGAYCWGDLNGSSTPVQVPGTGFVSIDAGASHVCALTQGGAASCWGRGLEGQLGNGASLSSNVPVAVSGGLTFVSISAGGTHSCGLVADGTAYCWGNNGTSGL